MFIQEAHGPVTAEQMAVFRAFTARERLAKVLGGRDPFQMWPTSMLTLGPDGRSAVTWLRELAQEQIDAETSATSPLSEAAVEPMVQRQPLARRNRSRGWGARKRRSRPEVPWQIGLMHE